MLSEEYQNFSKLSIYLDKYNSNTNTSSKIQNTLGNKAVINSSNLKLSPDVLNMQKNTYHNFSLVYYYNSIHTQSFNRIKGLSFVFCFRLCFQFLRKSCYPLLLPLKPCAVVILSHSWSEICVVTLQGVGEHGCMRYYIVCLHRGRICPILYDVNIRMFNNVINQ